MKKLAALSIILFLLLTACKTGPLKDIRLGKSFAVLIPERIPIYKSPSLKSETFYIKEAEAFVVEDVTCADGMSTALCFLDLAGSKQYPENAKVAFYKVRFESGTEGFINAGYFYPELSYSMTSEEIAAVRGMTPKERALEARERRQRAEEEVKELDRKRRAAIEAAPWTDEDKQLVLSMGFRIGMTKDQLMLSHVHPFRVPNIKETVTEKGAFEEWTFEDIVFYFEDGRLVKWKRPVKDAFEHMRKSPRDE